MPLTDDFKAALGSWASGVSVVTAEHEGAHYGLTVSSFSSLSLDPPLVLVCLNNHNPMCELVQRAGGFAVSILSSDQQAASNYFSSRGRLPGPLGEADAPFPRADAPGDRPALVGSLAWLDCDLHESIVRGDHTIVIGEVRRAGARQDATPLAYYRRGYRALQLDPPEDI